MYMDTMVSYIETKMPDATVGDVLGYHEIIQKAKGILPPPNNGGVFGISETKERFSEIPHSMRYLVNFQVPGINYTVATSSIAEESISIAYVPATSGDAALIENAGGIFNVLAYLVRMKPILKVNGEIVAEGLSTTLGSSQTLYSSFSRPENETWSTTVRGLTAGSDYNINLDIQRVSLDLLAKRLASLESMVENNPSGEPETQEMIEEALYLTGLSYFAKTDVVNDLVANDLGIIWTRQPAQAIVAQDLTVTYLLWWAWRVSRGSLNIDVNRDTVNPISTTGKHEDELAWMFAMGSAGSAAEHEVFEKLYEIEAVSTEKILALANRQGIPIYTIDSTNVDTALPKLNTFPVVINNIKNAVEKGWIAICPQRNITVNSWTGQGWIIMDPSSGSAGYLLAGRMVSSNTVEIINGGSGTEPKGLEDIPFEHLTHLIHTFLHDMGVLGVGCAYLGALVKLWPYITVGSTWVVLLQVSALLAIGVLAIGIGLWLVWASHHPITISTRRRKYLNKAFA